MSLVLVSLGQGQAQHTQQARHLMEIRFSVLVVLIVFLALNAAVQLRTLAAVQGLAAQQHAISPPGTDAPALEILSTRKVASQGLATQQHAVSPPGTDAAALEIALNERRLAFVLATDAKFDEPTRTESDRNVQLASNRWCTKWGETTSRKTRRGSDGGCSAANVVLMNDVDMVIEIAKELGWKDDLKPVAVFGSKAWLDNPYNSEGSAYDRVQWKIFEEKKSQLENYDLKLNIPHVLGKLLTSCIRDSDFMVRVLFCSIPYCSGPSTLSAPHGSSWPRSRQPQDLQCHIQWRSRASRAPA